MTTIRREALISGNPNHGKSHLVETLHENRGGRWLEACVAFVRNTVRLRIAGLLVILLFASIACRTDAVPKEIWVPERATELKVARGTVGYTVQETYPANRVRRELERELGAKGYKRLNRDALDPTGPELSPEWRSYVDGRNGGEQCTWEIVEDWQKADGGVIRLELRYVAPCEKPPAANVEPRTDTLRVNAIILGAADIERLRKTYRRPASSGA